MKIDEPDDEDQAPPEQVGELAAGEHERAEGERVARDHPLELARSGGRASSWIAGSATFTIVLSSMIMKRPNDDRRERPPLPVLGAKSLAFIPLPLSS